MLDARVWFAAAVVAPAVVVGGAVVLLVVPMREDAAVARMETADQLAANDVQRGDNARLAERSAGLDGLRAEADEIRRRVPAALDPERLSRELHDRASESGMTVSTFTQSPALEVSGPPAYVRVPLTVTFTGPETSSDPLGLLSLLQAAPGEPFGDGHDLIVTDVQIAGDDEAVGDGVPEVELTVSGYLALSVEPPGPEPEDGADDEDLVT